MHSVVISGTGLYQPPHVITNAELVEAFNRYVDLQNAEHAQAIAAGTREPLVHSSVEFIEKASGIKQRYVIEKEACWTRRACTRASRNAPTTSCR